VNHDVWPGIHVGHLTHTHAHAGLDPRQEARHPAQAGTHAHTHEDPLVEGQASLWVGGTRTRSESSSKLVPTVAKYGLHSDGADYESRIRSEGGVPRWAKMTTPDRTRVGSTLHTVVITRDVTPLI
jgi:hypothetical protein